VSTPVAPSSDPSEPPPPISEPTTAAPTGVRRLAAALTYRDFRILWIGAFLSTIGTWMQRVAQQWLVLALTTGASSAFFLGLDSFMGELPILLLMLVAGVIADRHDRRRILLMSQVVQMSAAFTLAALVYWDIVEIWHVLALSTVTGFAQAFGGPAYQSLLPALVGRDDVPNAIAFNSIQFNLARFVGPPLAGATLALFGMVACFGLNGLSFLFVIAAILSLHVRHTPPTSTTRLRQEFASGLAYVREHPALVSLALLGFAATFLGNPVLTFLPLVAQDVFGGDIAEYTYFLSAAGAGAVTGALVVAWYGRFRRMGRALLIVQVVFGVLVTLFAATRDFWVGTALLFGIGACMVMVFATLSSLVQLNAPDQMRGRVMSLYLVAFRGGMPLGSLAAGWLATRVGAPAVLMVNGMLLGLVAVVFLLRRGGVRET
jgi:MFS family permease